MIKQLINFCICYHYPRISKDNNNYNFEHVFCVKTFRLNVVLNNTMWKYIGGFSIAVLIVFAYKYQQGFEDKFATTKVEKNEQHTSGASSKHQDAKLSKASVTTKPTTPPTIKIPSTATLSTKTTSARSSATTQIILPAIVKTLPTTPKTTTPATKSKQNEAEKKKSQDLAKRVLQDKIAVVRKIIRKRKKKMILSFTKVYGEKTWWDVPVDNVFSERDGKPCRFDHCKLTYNKQQVKSSDAVLCHANDLPKKEVLKAARASSKQIWVWMTSQSPASFRNHSLEPYKDLFNWTGSYRRGHADLWTPYFFIKPLELSEKRPNPLKNYARGKDKMVLALMSSNCDSYRIKFVRALKKFINVDVYGKCKEKVNPQLAGDCKLGTKCDQLKKRYKFTLSLESAYCTDYVTEKFYYNGLMIGNIPVTMNRGKMSDPKVAPPNSFVNILDFENVETLANHLKKIASSDKLYNQFHAWRQNFKLGTKNRMCSICEALWKRDLKGLKGEKKIDFDKEWSYEKDCVSYEHHMFNKYLE